MLVLYRTMQQRADEAGSVTFMVQEMPALDRVSVYRSWVFTMITLRLLRCRDVTLIYAEKVREHLF